MSGDVVEIPTARGPARVHLQPAEVGPRRAHQERDGADPARAHLQLAGAGSAGARLEPAGARPGSAHPAPAGASGGLLMLGHGAGGGVSAADLQATASAARAAGWDVALVEQPYRVAGRRGPAPAGHLDTAWSEVAQHLLAGPFAGRPLVTGGRSSGARVACRTSAALDAVGVLCLAFPLQPPARTGRPVRPSRLPELDGVAVPTLVVQGERDPFGLPPAAPDRDVVVLPGDHSLDRDLPAIGAAVGDWLARLPLEPPAH